MALKWFVGSGVRVDKQAMSHSPLNQKKKEKKGKPPNTTPLSHLQLPAC